MENIIIATEKGHVFEAEDLVDSKLIEYTFWINCFCNQLLDYEFLHVQLDELLIVIFHYQLSGFSFQMLVF